MSSKRPVFNKPISSRARNRAPIRHPYVYKRFKHTYATSKKRKRGTDSNPSLPCIPWPMVSESHYAKLLTRKLKRRKCRPQPFLIDLSNEQSDVDTNSNSNSNSNHQSEKDTNNTNNTNNTNHNKSNSMDTDGDQDADATFDNQEQYIEQISHAANHIINSISNNVHTLNVAFSSFECRIQNAPSLSSLFQIQSIATESDLLSNCNYADTIDSFKKLSKDIIDGIIAHYRNNTNDLDQEWKRHIDKRVQLASEIKVCDENIRLLQKHRNVLLTNSEKIESVILKCKADKDNQITLKTECIDKVQRKIEEVEMTYNQLLPNIQFKTLNQVIGDKLKDFERDYREWNVTDVVHWIKLIENGYFNNNCIEYEPLFDQMIKLNVNGNKLKEMSVLFLETIGLNTEDQRILRKHISKITKQQNMRNICGFCTENMIDTVLIPCGHQYYCSSCADKQQITNCPICRTKVSQLIKAFMSGFDSNDN